MKFKDFVGEFLTLLERQESRLLSWGFYNGSFDSDQVEEWMSQAQGELSDAWGVLHNDGHSLGALLEQLAQERLLHELPGTPGRFRTRFAEGVRLIAGLRQLFPNRAWIVAPRLVSDIRIDLAPRCYAKRGVSAEECWVDLEPSCSPGTRDLLHDCFSALARDKQDQTLSFTGFQRRAFAHIFRAYGRQVQEGSVVSAGTGSGKTKAFYVPAFLRIVDEISQQRQAFTKLIAIYPRNVLLADQLREALSEALKLRPVLEKAGLRQMTFGALLGDTPYDEDFQATVRETGKLRAESRHWRRSNSSFAVPFLKSPNDASQDLLWRDSDRILGHTCLYTGGSPNEPDIPNGVLRLTREQLQKDPPDVLFLSAEMLNREMGNSEWSRTFGIGRTPLTPRLILLDEVHTYQGIQGAQISWLLRRWRHWTKARTVHFVGLSATLRDASAHLARVVGIPPGNVADFQAATTELSFEGVEYNLAVKGNPAGGSLLATSIQSAMLVTRLLAPPQALDAGPEDIYGNAFSGRKVFGFTDNLDTLNRWLGDMADAERKQLARLRQAPPNETQTERERRYADGQLWELPRAIGHNLNVSLRVSGCSSQRPGFNASSDLVIATSSLEVGFDDPEVGAIIHHKRPVSMASFVQRKGRAGRRKGMRPWTVVVLSDYGSDRYMFQNAERLFRPEIDSIFLPVRNPFVLRQQAVYFLIDWLGLRVRRGGPFTYLRPFGSADAQRDALALLRGLLEQQTLWSRFHDDFEKMFSIPAAAADGIPGATSVDSILWSAPRSLLLEVVPTLIRKLETGWKQADPQTQGAQEDRGFTRPLPAFIPAATFGQLDLAELTLRFPNGFKDDEQISIGQGLYEFCPGRVSKRYSTGAREPGYWLNGSACVLQPTDEVRSSIRNFFRDLFLLESTECSSGQVLVYQPLSASLVPQPSQITERSNAQWNWESRLRLISAGSALPLARSGVWATALRSGTAHLHREQSGVELLRFARTWEFNAQLTRPRGTSKTGRGTLASEDNGHSVEEAVGFRIRVDGVRWVISDGYLRSLPNPHKRDVERLRSDFYLYLLRTDPELSGLVDRFSAEWLHRTSLGMLVGTALRQHCSLADAQIRLKDRRVAAAQKILEDILPVAGDDEHSLDMPVKLRDNLLSLWQNSTVQRRIEELERSLWVTPGPEFELWMKRRFLSAMGQAFRLATLSRVEGVSEDDLILDIVWDGTSDAELYLTEETPGGLGHIEAVVAEMRRSPESFPEGVRNAFSLCPRQDVADSLLAFLDAILHEPSDGPLRQAMNRLRNANDFKQIADASESLRSALSEAGLDSSRSLVVALVSRFLRPGSSFATDRLTYFVNRLWRKHAQRIGIPIDPAVWAYICATYEPSRRRFSAALGDLSGGQEPTPAQIYRLVQQLLIESCEDSCPECLVDHNRYNDAAQASRALGSRWFVSAPPIINLDNNNDWQRQLRELLCRDGMVDLKVSRDKAAHAMAEIQGLLAEELEVESMLVPASITAVRRKGSDWIVSLQLRGLVA